MVRAGDLKGAAMLVHIVVVVLIVALILALLTQLPINPKINRWLQVAVIALLILWLLAQLVPALRW